MRIARILLASALAAGAIGVAVLIPRAATRATSEGEDATDRAVQLANHGDIEGAIGALRGHLDRTAGDVRARVVLGKILDFDGRPDEAVGTWEKGLTGAASDFPLLMAIGEIRHRQGKDGPTISYRRGMVAAHPSRDEAAEARFKRTHLDLAAAAYEKARKLRPDVLDAAKALASVYNDQDKPDAAAGVWKALVEREPKNGEYRLGLALATREAGRADEAAEHLRAAIALNPRLAEAHKALAEYQDQKGQAAEAQRSRKRAEFYGRLPSFATLTDSEENREILEHLDEKETVDALVADPSARAAEFLAVLCWSHPHDELEVRAFDALEARGAATTPLLRSLLDGAHSTCTIRSTAHILARRKADGLLNFLVERLPGDVRGVGMDMDIAGSLDDLGDPRAVGPLAEMLKPGDAGAEEDGMLTDRSTARGRAALALGAFDTPESRRALDAATRDARLAPYARAALYRLTRDPDQLEALEKSVGPDDLYAGFVVGHYLDKKVGTGPAKALARRWEQHREERLKADEKQAK